jgi:hypothetical protein
MPGTLLALLQFFFALTWVVYVIFLPRLAEQAGLERRYVPMILLLDQVIFLACDWVAGVYADRSARLFGRVGNWMAIVALVSCTAFMVLPWVAPGSAKAFLVVIVIWSVTSSALRAPSLAVASRHTGSAAQGWVPCAFLLGLGAASAIAPYLAVELRQFDPRIPFAISSVALAAFVLALARVERTTEPRPVEAPSDLAPVRRPPLALFVVVILLFAFGFQVHFTVNSAQGYLRFATTDDLPKLMPVFWIGFNIALVPAMLLTRRFGGAATMVTAGVIGVLALIGCARAPSLVPLVIAQSFAGAAWSIALMSAFSAALEAGRPGREGFLTGVLFSTLAAASIARLGIFIAGLQAHAVIGPRLENLPFIAWALAAFLMAMVAYPERARVAGPGPPSPPATR